MPEPTVPTGEAPPSSANDVAYFQLFNARNAKIVAFSILAFAAVYHALLKLHYGEDTCIGLLEDGRYQGSHVWQPYGCMLHAYSQRNGRMCMKYKRYWRQQNYLVFVGDQRTRQLFYAFLRQITAEHVATTTASYFQRDMESAAASTDLSDSFVDHELNLTAEFIWDPLLTRFFGSELPRFIKLPPTLRPIIIIGSLADTMTKQSGDDVGRNYSMLSKLAAASFLLQNGSRVLWMAQGYVDESKLAASTSNMLYNNLHIRKSSFESWNTEIDTYNDEADHVLSDSKVKIWRSASLLCSEKADSPDGVLIGKIALDYDAQILLNYYCNDYMNFPDGTCCRKAEPKNVVQTCAFVVYLTSIAFTCVIGLLQRYSTRRNKQYSLLSWDSSEDNNRRYPFFLRKDVTITFGDGPVFNSLFAWSKFCAIMLLIYACDRSNYFMNENKWFTLLNFFLPTVYLIVLGLFFTEETGKTGFMHRDQTNEWKGWMQLVIMVYNMTGASQVIWIYMVYRTLISGYLFLLGYGHFMYFWTTGDFTLQRTLSVLLRYNFLVLLLCVTMNRPYQFYEYAALVTYWYLVIYVTLAIPPHITSSSTEANNMHYFAMIMKFVVVYSVISILYLSEVFFENIFLSRPWKALFVMSDDSIQEWWQRWWLDRYTAANGMVCAFAVLLLRRFFVLTDGQPCNIFSRRLTIISFIASACGLLIYCLIAVRCGSRSDCNEIHGYVSFIPILSYLLLRNIFGALRTRASSFFAWFGKISLELFIAQPHLWLAADAHGVLVLWPRWPVFNVILTSFMFVCFAHELNVVTKQLIPVIIPYDVKVVIRNVLILIAICTPLALLYGML